MARRRLDLDVGQQAIFTADGDGIRIAGNALAIAGIQGGRGLIQTGREWSVMKEDTTMEGIAGCAMWLLSDLGRSTTGEVIHVDAGFHMMGMGTDEES